MLVLTRKVRESILIGENIEVVILEVVAGKVRVGIKAPNDCRILRTELLEPEEERTRDHAAD